MTSSSALHQRHIRPGPSGRRREHQCLLVHETLTYTMPRTSRLIMRAASFLMTLASLSAHCMDASPRRQKGLDSGQCQSRGRTHCAVRIRTDNTIQEDVDDTRLLVLRTLYCRYARPSGRHVLIFIRHVVIFMGKTSFRAKTNSPVGLLMHARLRANEGCAQTVGHRHIRIHQHRRLDLHLHHRLDLCVRAADLHIQ